MHKLTELKKSTKNEIVDKVRVAEPMLNPIHSDRNKDTECIKDRKNRTLRFNMLRTKNLSSN